MSKTGRPRIGSDVLTEQITFRVTPEVKACIKDVTPQQWRELFEYVAKLIEAKKLHDIRQP